MPGSDMAVLEMLGGIYEELDIDSIEKRFVDLVNDVFHFDRVALFFVKHKKGTLHGKLSRGLDSKIIENLEIPVNENSFFIKPLITGAPVRKSDKDDDQFVEMFGLTNSALIPVVNKKRVSCWEIKNCKALDCPAYGKKWLRCWLISGSKHSDGSEITAAEKAARCARCQIFTNLSFETVEGIMLVDNSISHRPITDEMITMLSIISYTVGNAVNNSKLYMKTLDVTIRDDLTGLHNRRYFNERLSDETERAPKYGDIVSLIMCDIDHFKNVNDTYGHPRGDLVLRWVAEVLQKSLRKTDIISRYGGEEFAILLMNTGKTEALNIAEKLRQSIEKAAFGNSNGDIRITLSFGVASLGSDSNSPEGLIMKADKALYFAKARGRNQVSAC